MKLSTILLAFVLLEAGNVCAQEVRPEKKATAYMVADAHLDTQWNWDIQTTIKEYVWNTLSRNLFLLKKYPNYIFNFEGGVKYSWMKEYYPSQYEQLKALIHSGRWHVSGKHRMYWCLLLNHLFVILCSGKNITGKSLE